MRKPVIIGLGLLVAVGWIGSWIEEKFVKQEQPASAVAETIKHDEKTSASVERHLGGITSGDLRVQFEKRGLDCTGPRQEATRASWICTDGSYRVEFLGKSPTRIEYITGTAIGIERQAATTFLSYVASLPYKGSVPEQAQNWVSNQESIYAETVIGGTKIRLSGPAQAPSVSLTCPSW